MNWINIHTDTLRSEEYLGADPVERATWLNLLAWCCAQENGGVIKDCRDWKDRMWQQLCGVTKAEVETNCLLFGFEGQSLKVSFYPKDAEKKVQALRENGRKGGRPKKKPLQLIEDKAEKPKGLALVNQKDTICLNEKKGKGNVREVNTKVSTIVSGDTGWLFDSLWTIAPRMSRQRSSKKQVEAAWKKIKSKPEPTAVIEAMNAWIRSEEWTRDGGKYVQGLHLWIKNEKWETPPESPKANADSKFGSMI